MDYKVSVVIPTYNTGDALIGLVDSIKQQTIGFENIELLIIDDNSNCRDTLDLIKSYDELDNCTAVFFNENHNFPGTGRNKGLEIANGEFIIFSDHDDTYPKDAFELLYNKAVENNADMTFANYYKVFPDKKIPYKTKFNGENIIVTNVSEDERLFSLSPSIWTKLFRRKFLLEKNIRFIEGMLAEDFYVFIFALLTSSKTVYLDNFYVYNYSIRDSKSDKSTIHLRNFKVLDNMINGYYETDRLLMELSMEKYFYSIFKNHFIYWLDSLIYSEIAKEDKIKLLEKINPLMVKHLSINPTFGAKLYDMLTDSVLNQDYKKILKNLKHIKFIKSFVGLVKK